MPATFSRTMASLRADSGRRALLLIAAAVLLLGAWGGWFFFSRVALYETGPARLEVVREVHAVQAPVAGRVVRSRVVLDREVKAGTLLVELDNTALRLKLEEMRIGQGALVDQVESLRRVVEAEGRALSLARQAALASVDEAQARHRERRVKADFNKDKASRMARLRKGGHLAEFDFLKAQADSRAGQTAAETLRISVERLRKDQRTADSDRRARLARLSSDLVLIKGKLATSAAGIKRLQHELERRRIRAPVAGRVGELTPLRVGAYVDEG